MSGYYLLDNPPRRSQYRKPRRERPSGTIVLHSTESIADVNPPDTGAENVARFIRNRSDPGSYHLLCDSDSTIRLVPLGYEAFHDGTGTNPHSIGISGAFRAHQFAGLPAWWRDGCIRQMAQAARGAADWLHENYGVTVPARRITVAQAKARTPGFVTHGMLDPQRRTDPDGTNTGARFPWARFFAHYQEDDDMPLTDDDIQKVADAVWTRKLVREGVGMNAAATLVIGDIFHHARRGAIAQGADVDEVAIAQEILAHLDPEKIAAAIPMDLADKVADVLASRLKD